MADTTQETVQQTEAKERTKSSDKGSEQTGVSGGPAEKAEGEINPSSPGNTGTTPGSNAKLG